MEQMIGKFIKGVGCFFMPLGVLFLALAVLGGLLGAHKSEEDKATDQYLQDMVHEINMALLEFSKLEEKIVAGDFQSASRMAGILISAFNKIEQLNHKGSVYPEAIEVGAVVGVVFWEMGIQYDMLGKMKDVKEIFENGIRVTEKTENLRKEVADGVEKVRQAISQLKEKYGYENDNLKEIGDLLELMNAS